MSRLSEPLTVFSAVVVDSENKPKVASRAPRNIVIIKYTHTPSKEMTDAG